MTETESEHDNAIPDRPGVWCGWLGSGGMQGTPTGSYRYLVTRSLSGGELMAQWMPGCVAPPRPVERLADVLADDRWRGPWRYEGAARPFLAPEQPITGNGYLRQ